MLYPHSCLLWSKSSTQVPSIASCGHELVWGKEMQHLLSLTCDSGWCLFMNFCPMSLSPCFHFSFFSSFFFSFHFCKCFSFPLGYSVEKAQTCFQFHTQCLERLVPTAVTASEEISCVLVSFPPKTSYWVFEWETNVVLKVMTIQVFRQQYDLNDLAWR